MTHNLERITTQYIEIEDRLRIAAGGEDVAPIVLWFSQRLMTRVLRILFQWLEGHHGAAGMQTELMQSFAQQAAVAELAPQAPVPADDGTAWLVLAVDVEKREQTIGLAFRGVDGVVASMSLEPKPLRQWLQIVQECYRLAEWPLDVWPAWMCKDQAAPVSAVLH